MGNRESSFDETATQNTNFRSNFFWIANKPKEFAPRRAFHGPRHPPTPIARAGFEATANQHTQHNTAKPQIG
jgi:hypothetical protein